MVQEALGGNFINPLWNLRENMPRTFPVGVIDQVIFRPFKLEGAKLLMISIIDHMVSSL